MAGPRVTLDRAAGEVKFRVPGRVESVLQALDEGHVEIAVGVDVAAELAQQLAGAALAAALEASDEELAALAGGES